MSSPFYELYKKAQIEIDTNRHPRIEDFLQQLDEILIAAKLDLGDRVSVTDMFEEFDSSRILHLVIKYTWASRGCMQFDEITVPMHIIESPDPIDAARKYAQQRDIKMLEFTIVDLESEIKYKMDTLKRYKSQLIQLGGKEM